MENIKPVRPPFTWMYGNGLEVTYTYNHTMTLLENVYALYKEIQEITKSQNELIQAFKQFIEWAEQEISEQVGAKLEVWLNDGTLANLINVTIFEDLNRKIDRLNVIYLDDFGVVGTDITSNLDLAVSYMNANKGTTLELPVGKFDFSNTIRIKDTTGMIKGQGKMSTILNYTGTNNAIEIGYIDATGDSWDLGYTTVVDIKNLTLTTSNGPNNKNGLVIHTIGSTIDDIIVSNFSMGHGLLAKQLGYFNVINSTFKLCRVGVYAFWSIYFNNCHITNNSLVGVFLGGSCKLDNSLIEWQKPTTGFNPNTRLINMITFNGSAVKTFVTNSYIEHDHVHYGFNQKYNPDIVGFEVGEMVNTNTSVTNCTFTDQPQQYIHTGILEVDGNRFNGSNFGISSATPYNAILPTGATLPKVKIGKLNEHVNINRMGEGNYVSLDKAQSLLKNTTFAYSDVSSGANTQIPTYTGELKSVGHLWVSGDFNSDQRVLVSDNTWDKNPVLHVKNYLAITTVDFPKISYDIDVEQGVTYYVSFNAKTPGDDIMLYTCVSESGIEYLQSGYTVNNLTRQYDAVRTAGQWSRRLKSFTALKTEKVTLMFNTESKSQGKNFYLQSVNVSNDPGKL